mmetsp:Transcript_28522/g.59602  ORF Transcript_28522/g.59602 Transcript_28522/m.59602 type:complete len:83 (-) Transcript_28522:1089-1337(-)
MSWRARQLALFSDKRVVRPPSQLQFIDIELRHIINGISHWWQHVSILVSMCFNQVTLVRPSFLISSATCYLDPLVTLQALTT